ncbi:MAG: alcohol dehydrogenase catalytic domain-containing protein [Armatimonadota bacterium]
MALVGPLTAQALIFRAQGDLRLEEVPIAAPGPGELLLRITACGLCPGEVMDWYMARKAPVPLGHEAVGEVVEAGSGADFRPGERVFVHHHAPCLTCRTCRRGEYVHCATWRSRRLVPGGLATYALAQAPAVVADALRLPPDLSDETATFIEPLACVLKAVRRARIRRDDRVLVIGAGVMGLLHLMVLRAQRHASLIIAADRVPARLAATAGHADLIVDVSQRTLADAVREATGGEGADVAVVGPGSIEALESGLQSLAPGGTLVVFTPTPPDQAWHLRVHDLFFREITILPSYSAGPDDTREALRLLQHGLPVGPLITHRLPLVEARAGYDLIRATGPALKVVVRP